MLVELTEARAQLIVTGITLSQLADMKFANNFVLPTLKITLQHQPLATRIQLRLKLKERCSSFLFSFLRLCFRLLFTHTQIRANTGTKLCGSPYTEKNLTRQQILAKYTL